MTVQFMYAITYLLIRISTQWTPFSRRRRAMQFADTGKREEISNWWYAHISWDILQTRNTPRGRIYDENIYHSVTQYAICIVYTLGISSPANCVWRLLSLCAKSRRLELLSRLHCKSIKMMTSSNGNIFRVTGLFCGEFTGHRWIPLTKASDAGLWCFLWSAHQINGWVNNREAGDLSRNCAHYDVTVMKFPHSYSKQVG